MAKGVVAIDQGTTSSRAIVFDDKCRLVCTAQQEFPQIYPADGWVEHDPEAIWQTTLEVTRQAIANAAAKGVEAVAIGITNQRETTVVWERNTGKPIYNAIVWQDRRTAEQCRALHAAGHEATVASKTGLLLDPYFSASKIAWILDNVDGARSRAERGELLFGTIDCFLLWRLTGGTQHATDATNASRTCLYNIHSGEWDAQLLTLFNVPAAMLPEVRDCDGDYGVTAEGVLDRPLPIRGIAGDQQAAAIGQGCFTPGTIKSTYGTGCFVLLNTGDKVVRSNNKLLSTVAFQFDGQRRYAVEGSIFVAGAAVQWLRDGIAIVDSAAETEQLAASVVDDSPVYMVPAFTGLGVPYWQPDARGAIFGITRATGRAELVRATLEAICYMTQDLFAAMAEDGTTPKRLRVDGGMVANDWLLQFLADVLDMEVVRPVVLETTALGAAWLAGSAVGLYGDQTTFTELWQEDASFTPGRSAEWRKRRLAGWQQAVRRVLTE